MTDPAPTAATPTGPPVEGRPPTHVVIDAGATLTGSAAADLRAAVARAVQDGWVLDLRLDGVTTFDTTGLGLLVGLHRQARAAGAQLVCLRPTPALLAAMRQLGLHRVLQVRLDGGPSRT